MLFSVAGLSWDTWNTGWTESMESGRQIVNDSEPTCVMIRYGLRFFLESFLEGQVNWKYLALTYTWSPTLKSGAGECLHQQLDKSSEHLRKSEHLKNFDIRHINLMYSEKLTD